MSELMEPTRLELLDAEHAPAQPLAVQQPAAVAPVTVDDVIARAAMAGATPEQMMGLLAVAERMTALQVQQHAHRVAEQERQAVLDFRRDFAAFRGENIIVPKTKHVDRGQGGSFDQAEFHIVSQMLSPALSKYGFSFRHDQKFGAKPWTTDGVVSDVPWVYVTCYLEHRGGHMEKLDLEGPPGELKVNTPVQNMQVTGSFLKRQSLLAITGTATGGEDDEGRMRGRGKAPSNDEGGDALQTLIDAGQAEAMQGMKALTEWWRARSAREQKDLQKAYGAMRHAAAAADKGVQHG